MVSHTCSTTPRIRGSGPCSKLRILGPSRPDRGRFKKAGNLQYGFQRTTGEYILILDADFAARSDLLAELLPYFRRLAVRIVQSPQFFRVLDQQNWVERGAGAVQELFYRSVQVSLQRTRAAICVGSCAPAQP